MNTEHKISVIIPIYNRPDELDDLLGSISRASLPQGMTCEMIVVEDGSTVTSQDVCLKWEETLDIKYFPKENTGPGASRNYGMERATGDYFVILDSDCLLPKNYFETLEGIISRADAPHAISGPDKAHHSFTDIQKAVNYAMTSFLTTGGLRGGSKNVCGTRQLRSYNMVISRHAYDVAGGFSRQRIGEDIEYTHRLWANDLVTEWNESLFVYHKRRADLESFFHQVYNFGKARPILNRMFPGTAKLTYIFPSLFLGFVVLSALTGMFAPIWMTPLWLYMALILISSWYMNKDIKVGLLSVATALVMFVGYGAGFMVTSVRLMYSDDMEDVFPYMFKH